MTSESAVVVNSVVFGASHTKDLVAGGVRALDAAATPEPWVQYILFATTNECGREVRHHTHTHTHTHTHSHTHLLPDGHTVNPLAEADHSAPDLM